jgi:hypothetical protein
MSSITTDLTEVEKALLDAVMGLSKTPAVVLLEMTVEQDGLAFLDTLFAKANAAIDEQLAAKFGGFAALVEGYVDPELASLEAKLKALVTSEVSKVTSAPAPSSTPAPAVVADPNKPVPTVAGQVLR